MKDQEQRPLTSDEAGQLIVGQRIIGVRPRFGARWLRPTWNGEAHCFEEENGVEVLLANGAVLHTIRTPLFVDRPEGLKGGDDQTRPLAGTVWPARQDAAPARHEVAGHRGGAAVSAPRAPRDDVRGSEGVEHGSVVSSLPGALQRQVHGREDLAAPGSAAGAPARGVTPRRVSQPFWGRWWAK